MHTLLLVLSQVLLSLRAEAQPGEGGAMHCLRHGDSAPPLHTRLHVGHAEREDVLREDHQHCAHHTHTHPLVSPERDTCCPRGLWRNTHTHTHTHTHTNTHTHT